MTWDEWFKALKEFVADRKVAANWAKQSGDVAHTLESIAREIQEWKIKNPPPPHPRRPPPLPSAGAKKLGTGAVDIAQLQHQHRVYNQTGHAGSYIRTARNLRKGEQGATTLGMLVALGGVPLVALGAAVVKFAIENVVWDMAEQGIARSMNALMEALMPATVQEAESQYQAYVWNIKTHWSKLGPNVIPILTREEWIWREYGVRWDALRQ